MGEGGLAMTVDDILSLARAQLGTKENPMGSNHVKYNNEYYEMEVKGPEYPWCCVFQWWLFRHAGGEKLFFGGGKTASCTALWRDCQKRGREVDKGDILPGDLVFFVFDGGKSGGMNHVGICEKVEPGYVTTIDGNTGGDEANGGTVARKRRSLKYVGGAARPDYEPETATGAGTAVAAGQSAATAGSVQNSPAGQRLYRYVSEMPEWAREAAAKAIRLGVLRMDESGAVGVWESNLQSLVWLERLGLLEPGESRA